jgi:hypothetical protein
MQVYKTGRKREIIRLDLEGKKTNIYGRSGNEIGKVSFVAA